jgi:hypothetical protein
MIQISNLITQNKYKDIAVLLTFVVDKFVWIEYFSLFYIRFVNSRIRKVYAD